jgi:hypothetical protein
MLEVFQDAQALLDNGVALPVPDVNDEADAACVMFVGGVVKTLAAGESHLYFLDTKSSPTSGRAAPMLGSGRAADVKRAGAQWRAGFRRNLLGEP